MDKYPGMSPERRSKVERAQHAALSGWAKGNKTMIALGEAWEAARLELITKYPAFQYEDVDDEGAEAAVVDTLTAFLAWWTWGN